MSDPSYFDHPRPEVCDLVPGTQLRILELGCAAGALGSELRRRGVAETLHGIELNPCAAARARSEFDQVWEADLERLEDLVLEPPYDVLILADVLEHLRDPWGVLARAAQLIRPGGYVVASIPNVRYWRVTADLVLKGLFTYQEEGVLDRTHLRFFTRASIGDLFECAELVVEVLQRRQPVARSRSKLGLERLAGDFANPAFLIRARRPAAERLSGSGHQN